MSARTCRGCLWNRRQEAGDLPLKMTQMTLEGNLERLTRLLNVTRRGVLFEKEFPYGPRARDALLFRARTEG